MARSKRDVVGEWREQNIAELDANLEVWKSIRDDEGAANKDRIEAAKSISRQLGALSPDRVDTKSAIRVDPDKPRISPERQSSLDKLLNDIK